MFCYEQKKNTVIIKGPDYILEQVRDKNKSQNELTFGLWILCKTFFDSLFI